MRKARWGSATILSSLALLLLAGVASAHTHLKTSVPAEGSSVKAPEEITLSFSAAAQVTALTIQKEGEAERKLTPPVAAADHVAVNPGKLTPGKYTVSWRTVSGDGHVMSGKLHFTVTG